MRLNLPPRVGGSASGVGWREGSLPWPASPVASRVGANAKATHLQIIPAETILKPGESRQFKALIFNSLGEPIGECVPKWEVAGLDAEVDATGKLTAGDEGAFQGGMLTATYEGVKGASRVRVVSELPLRIDFEDRKPGLAPGGWISASPVKFKVVDLEGNKVLKKLSDKPKFILARMYFGRPIDKGYTMQVDLMGTEQKFQLPDMGFFVSRYRFDLLGNRQGARIVAWSPMPRLEKKIRFKWDPNVWYTAKMSVVRSPGKAAIKAKVWKRDAEEPAEWTIEIDDSTPNLGGAPGLYAYSAGSTDKKLGGEIYYDNIIVTATK